MVNCELLVNWLQLAIAATITGLEANGDPIVQVLATAYSTLTALALDEDLSQQRHPILEWDLPRRNYPNQASIEGSIMQLATVVAGNTHEG